MRLYEALFIVDPSLSADGIQELLGKLEGYIAKREGTIEQRVDRGRVNMGYEVKKKRDGFAYTVYFRVDPSKITKLEYDYKLVPELLKYSMFRKDDNIVPEVVVAKPVAEVVVDEKPAAEDSVDAPVAEKAVAAEE